MYLTFSVQNKGSQIVNMGKFLFTEIFQVIKEEGKTENIIVVWSLTQQDI